MYLIVGGLWFVWMIFGGVLRLLVVLLLLISVYTLVDCFIFGLIFGCFAFDCVFVNFGLLWV